MNYEIKSHEKRLYEIQSMLQGQPNPLNLSCTTENQMLMNQKQMNPALHYIAQSQANFSPRQFGTLANAKNQLQRQGSMNLLTTQGQPLMAQQPVEGGVIYNHLQGKVECAHCLQAIDTNDFYEHLQSHQQYSFIGLGGLNLTQASMERPLKDQSIKQHLSMTPQPTTLPPKPPGVQSSPRVPA